MLDITDCRDLITIQGIFFMILFLQSSAKLATCYAYIGIALRACCRLGLHRNLPNKFNPIELEERKRIFWLVRKMDGYVGAMLGLPQMLSEDDIDQELPAEVHDDYITADGIQAMPAGTFPLMKATNAHTKLTMILRKVVRYIYPIKGSATMQSDDRYTISHGRIRELEQELQDWMEELPMELRPSDNAGMELSRYVSNSVLTEIKIT
jgi:Fungal specific transcription factor domain